MPVTKSLTRMKPAKSKKKAAIRAAAAEVSAEAMKPKVESISSHPKGSKTQLVTELERVIQTKLMLSHGNHGVAVSTQIKWKALALRQG